MSCRSCSAGKFQALAGATTCDDCPSGSAQPDAGENKCDECQVNFIQLHIDLDGCPEPYTQGNPSRKFSKQTGKYTANSGLSVCEPCSSPFTTASTGATSCDACEGGSYLDQVGACRECTEGVKCKTAGRLETLELEPGWYRSAFLSRKVYTCSTQGACIGGNGGNDSQPHYW